MNEAFSSVKSVVQYVVLLLIITVSLQSHAQIVINEACSANLYSLYDEDNDAEDWIEIFNKSADTLSLRGYFLSDKKSEPQKWGMPDITIYPDSFALVFASGKNRSDVVNHWETAVYCDSLWKYLNPDYEPDPKWEWPSFSDTAWNEGYGGFGYADDDDTTITADTLRTIYLRNTFLVEDTSKILNAILHMDYDDGFVMYLNGHEIIRENIQPDGKTPHYQQTAMFTKEAQMYQGGLPAMFVINKPVLDCYLKNGENLLAIQCHNRWDDGDMTFKPWLSFSLKDTTQQFGPVPEWFFADDIPLHTNFGIRSTGEKIYLFNYAGMLMDEMNVGALQIDNSFGRKTDGSDTLVWFPVPTPGNSNNMSLSYNAIISTIPQITPETGYYNDSVLVSIFSSDTTCEIHYSLDGSTPDISSPVFTEPFYIDTSLVIRARSFADGNIPSKTATQTYLFNDSSTLRVISIATNPEYLFDEDNGIYVFGNQYIPDPPYFGANFWKDIEVPVNIDLFDPLSEDRFSQDCGLKIHGGWSRYVAQKSIRPMAKGKYGTEYFNEKLFKNKPQRAYKRFVIRNAGNDHYSCFFRDAFMHMLVKNHADVDIMEYEPVLVYLNGRYWGMQNMREKIDRYYLESNYGVDPESVDILEEQGDIISGDNKDFLQLMEFVIQNDLSIPENYQTVDQNLNVNSFTDLLAINIFYINTDWPHNNMKWWRQNGGKWNYFLLDLDVSSSLMNFNKPYMQQLERVLNDSITVNAVLFREMLKNSDFKHYFINRYADLMNYTFRKQRMYDLTDTIVKILKPEMARHKGRWGNQTVTTWENYYVNDKFKGFIRDRHEHARGHVVEVFDLVKPVELHFEAYPDNSGHIHINTIYPEYMPFDGVYFDPVPITIEALPAPGFEFSYWKNQDSTWYCDEPVFQGVFNDNDTLIAVYSGNPDTSQIVISEIMHSPHNDVNCGDWLELYSADDEPVDVSEWEIQINNDIICIDKDITILPGEYLVFASDTIAFKNVYGDDNYLIEVPDLELRDMETSIELLDNYHNRINGLRYDVFEPWPDNTRFTGRTLELVDVDVNPEISENWINGCLGGSPGAAHSDCHDYPDIIFTEYNCNSCDCHDSDDWVEIYNNDTIAVDMTDWTFRDAGDDHAFLFPGNYVLEPESYAVIARDPVKFDLLYPEINVLSPFDFGLGEDDSLILMNRYRYEVTSLGYTRDTLWPNDIYGTGRTAELISVDSLSNSPFSWKNGCYGGTPMAATGTCHDNPDLIVSEIQYHPHEEYDGGTYFEIYNRDTAFASLLNWSVINRDSLVNTVVEDDVILEPGDYLVMAQNPDRFRSVFPDARLFDASTGIAFSSQPDSFGLQDKYGVTRLWMKFDIVEPWPVIEDSTGKALELDNYLLPFTDPTNWHSGCKEGSPGHEFRACDTTAVNEFAMEFSIAPNPFTNSFIISNNSNLRIQQLRLLNSNGEIEDEVMINSSPLSYRFSTQHLRSGLYILEIVTDDEMYYHKILKK